DVVLLADAIVDSRDRHSTSVKSVVGRGLFALHEHPSLIVPSQHFGVPSLHPQTPPCRWQQPPSAASKDPLPNAQGTESEVDSTFDLAAAVPVGMPAVRGDATTGCWTAVGKAQTPAITATIRVRFMTSPPWR